MLSSDGIELVSTQAVMAGRAERVVGRAASYLGTGGLPLGDD